jgi:hypothetical protein
VDSNLLEIGCHFKNDKIEQRVCVDSDDPGTPKSRCLTSGDEIGLSFLFSLQNGIEGRSTHHSSDRGDAMPSASDSIDSSESTVCGAALHFERALACA